MQVLPLRGLPIVDCPLLVLAKHLLERVDLVMELLLIGGARGTDLALAFLLLLGRALHFLNDALLPLE